MKKRYLLLLTFWLFSLPGFAQYMTLTIPDSLKENAHAVVRSYSEEFTVIDEGTAVQKIHSVVTIFNPAVAKRLGTLRIPYNQGMEQVKHIKGTLYNHLGVEIKKIKKSDIEDQSQYDGFSLFSDNRQKVASLIYPDLPYTVEFEYEVTRKSLLFYPVWLPIEGEHISVEKSSLTVNMPNHLKLRYKSLNLDSEVKIAKSAGKTSYKWEVKNLKAIKDEPYMASWRELYPIVYTAPTQFKIDEYSGDMSSWKSFGLWQNQLLANRNEIPENIKKVLSKFKAETPDKKELIRKTYEYLQNNTRYVSIQLGIGGWQPFEASFVAENGYGDCKALSNYMHSMLQELEIPSNYTLIRAGKRATPMLEDFPSNQFNHVILCVPLEQDTVWLECTSQKNPFGYLGTFTSDRSALMITPEGGKLTRTPKYTAKDNLQMRSGKVTVDANGNAIASFETVYTGIQSENISHLIGESHTNQEEWLYKRLDIADFQIKDFNFSIVKDAVPQAKETVEVAIRKCSKKSGSRLFLKPNILSEWSYVPPKVTERTTDLYLKNGYIDTDTIEYTLPEGYHIEHLPKGIQIDAEFGSYQAQFVQAENSNNLTYIRKIQLNAGRYSPESYEKYIKFRKDIAKADRKKVVLVNKS